MKIIKQGSLPEDRPYRSVCRRCNAEFEFLEKEGEVVFDQRDGNFVKIKCPCCGENCTHAQHRS